jgi:hypothetical protein
MVRNQRRRCSRYGFGDAGGEHDGEHEDMAAEVVSISSEAVRDLAGSRTMSGRSAAKFRWL